MEHTMIEVKKLEISKQNARRTVAKGAAGEMKASILAHGLMQNLIVTHAGKGKYRVIAGGRRLAALRELQKEGALPQDYAAPCQIVGDEHALELSLAENTVRLAMHPADEFEAFAKLIDGGDTTDQVAARFGVTAKHVEQRLKLGRADRILLDAYRAGKLTLDCLMAFTITDDRQKQVEVYEALEKWHGARDIRAMLTGETPEAKSKLAAFVGLDAYHEAGGVSRGDLFGEDIYLENPDLLNRLAGEKLDAIRRDLEAEGWLWVEISPDGDWSFINACSRIQPQPVNVPPELLEQRQAIEQELEDIERALEDTESDALIDAQDEAVAELAQIDGKIDALAAYEPVQKAIAGCYVSLDRDGKPQIERGLVRRQDRPKEPKAARTGLPETLKRSLEAFRLQSAQVEIAANPGIAFDLLAFNAALAAFAAMPPFNGPQMQLGKRHPAKEPTKAADALDAIRERLPKAWLAHASEADQFEDFCRLPEADKLSMLAFYVASSLKPQLATGFEATAFEQALSLTAGSVAAHWRPTAGNFLGRISRVQLLALGRDVLGEQWALSRFGDKKGELAAQLERAFAEPEKIAKNPQQLEKLKSWLPEGMAFGTVAEPPPAKAKKRKAA